VILVRIRLAPVAGVPLALFDLLFPALVVIAFLGATWLAARVFPPLGDVFLAVPVVGTAVAGLLRPSLMGAIGVWVSWTVASQLGSVSGGIPVDVSASALYAVIVGLVPYVAGAGPRLILGEARRPRGTRTKPVRPGCG
jgi:hypothetical protein